MATEPVSQAGNPDQEDPQTLLALPDSVLQLVASRLPSPDKKAARLVCWALHIAVNHAVASFLLTDTNLAIVASLNPKLCQQQQHLQQTHEPQPHQAHPRRGAALHQIFPNLTHLCLALSPAGGPDTRSAEQLRCLIRQSLPALRCLRCLDLALACRDVALGRTTEAIYDTWAMIVEGLPVGRPVQVLLNPPTALSGVTAGPGVRTAATPAAIAAATAAATKANDFFRIHRDCSNSNRSGDGCQKTDARHGGGNGGNSEAVDRGRDAVTKTSSDGSSGSSCLLADMLTLLAARRPAAEVRLVAAPLTSKRYDKPRIPSYGELLAVLAPRDASWLRAAGSYSVTCARCPAVTGLLLGPESFEPGGAAVAAATATVTATAIATATAGATVVDCDSERGKGGASGNAAVAWLPYLAAANARTGASLQHLTLWESWPLEALFCQATPGGAGGGGASGVPLMPTWSSSSCLLGLRRLVLSDQQAVLDRDRLCADALAPLAVLTHLTRLELASLTVNATAMMAAASERRGAAVHGSKTRRGGVSGGSGGSGGSRRAIPGGGGGTAMMRGGKVVTSAAPRAMAVTSLPQVRHLSVYHALRVVWSTNGDVYHDDYGSGGSGSAWHGGRGCASSAAPMAALFPSLRHLSACVTAGSPGRPASERWGYLAGLGSSLTSLHLRAVAAEDLCLQGRSEVLAALTQVTSLRLSADNGKVDGIRGLMRTIACLGPGLVALRLSRLATRGTDPRAAELALPRLTRLDFLGCSGDLIAAFDGLALSAVRLRRLEVRECATIRPPDLQWAIERQMGLRQLVIQDCPGLLAGPRGAGGPAAALRALLRPSLSLSFATTDSVEVRALRQSRRRAVGGISLMARGEGEGKGDDAVGRSAGMMPESLLCQGLTADDVEEL
ncbi:hypothetical protein VaNZ11_010828 [Volvox africanus]|uniref:F-box domain-containing protein n=1 Tax=Volvox africanus TaxID=51714 RepID=A0ABQ5SBD4_9CHLO|nr:hypothetical protein VaNZ11_010828 [Volvox africanus]